MRTKDWELIKRRDRERERSQWGLNLIASNEDRVILIECNESVIVTDEGEGTEQG